MGQGRSGRCVDETVVVVVVVLFGAMQRQGGYNCSYSYMCI